MSKLTEAQSLAVEGLHEDQVVTAGAGSGKTTVLVQRYINLIDPFRDQGPCAEPPEVLAITFTNKAAQEMKDRVRKELARRAAEAPDTAVRHRWAELAEALNDSLITTFHSLCSSLVRENPIEAGTDPGAALLAEHEAAEQLRVAIREAMSLRLEVDPVLAELLSRWGSGQASDAIDRLVRRVRGAGLSFAQLASPGSPDRDDTAILAARGAAIAEVRRMAESVYALSRLEGNSADMLASFTARRGQLEAALSELSREVGGGSIEMGLATVDENAQSISGNCVKALKAVATPFKEAVGALGRLLAEEQGTRYLAAILELSRESERLYREAKRRARALDYEDLLLLARDLLRNEAGVLAAYRERFRFILVDEFQDTDALQDEIISLLAGESPLPDSGSLFIVGDAKQSIYRFRHADVTLFENRRAGCGGPSVRPKRAVSLSDNFRTRPQVLQVVNAAFAELMSASPRQVHFEPLLPRRVTRGHGAAVELLEVDAAEVASADTAKVEARALAEWVRDVVETGRSEVESCRERLRHSHRAMGDNGLEALSQAMAGRNLLKRGVPVVFEPVKTSSSDDGDGSRGRRGASSRKRRGERPRPVRYADVALLLRTRGRLKDFEEALSEAGVPFYVGGAGFYERQEVIDLLSLLRCIDDSSDVVSLLAVLRSPLFGLYDDTILRLVQAHGGLWEGLNAGDITGLTPDQLDACQSASRVINLGRELRSRLPALDLIDLLLKQTGYEHVICRLPGGVQMAANLRRLREIASGLAVRGITELGDFLAEVRLITDAAREGEAPVQTEESDAVKILTVHAAKGLEFPVVILGDASRSSGPPESASFRISWSVPYGLGLRFPWAGDKRETRSFADSDQEDEAASDAESIRLLYVALTRARDYLLITGVDRGGKTGAKAEECWFGRLQKALAGLERPEQVRLTRVSARPGRGSAASPGQMDEISIPNGPGEGDLPLPARALIRYSLSEVQSYAICPKRYYYQYRLRVPPIGQDPWGEGEKPEPASAEVETEASADGTEALGRQARGPIPADTLGTAVHWVIERLRNLDAVEAMTSEAAEVHGLTGETAASRLARLVRTYVSSEEFEVVRRQGEVGVSSEVPLVCRLQKDVLVTGVADRLVHLPNGRVRLVDFKTNSVTAAAVDEVAERYRLQLPIYALALQQAGYEVEEASYFFLAPGVKRACDVSKGSLARVETEVAGMCRTMEADTLFTAREGTACDHCGYRPLCR